MNVQDRNKKPKHKLKFNLFPNWCYEQEQIDLNHRSAKGWHLIEPGQHFHKYEQNSAIQYRYQMDFHNIEPEPERYEEIYAEQGWELLGFSQGWYYFRKPYDPLLPEEAYEIFTDTESVTALRKRWARTALLGTIGSFLIFFIGMYAFHLFPSWLTLIPLLLLGAELIYCFYSAFMIRHPKKHRNPKVACSVTLLYTIFLVVGILVFIYVKIAHIRTDFGHLHTIDAPIPAGMKNAVELDSFDIYLSDNYRMDLIITADASVCFAIRNEQGDTVFTATADNCHYPKHCITLKKGNYTAYFSDFTGSSAQVYYKFE